jgi:endoglucanase
MCVADPGTGTGGSIGTGGTVSTGGTRAGGTGGTISTGGTGGSIGPGTCAGCTASQVCSAEGRCIAAGTIDDFGSCDAKTYSAEGRSGTWFSYMGDGVNCSTRPCAGFSMVPWGLGACGAWTRGGLYDELGEVFAGVGVGLNQTGVTYDACGYTSVEVTYATDQAIRMYAKWNYTGELGTRSYVSLPATSGTRTTTVKLSAFSGIVCSKLTEFQFEPSSVDAGFGVAIYGLRFVGAGSPTTCTSGDVRCGSSTTLETCVGGAWTSAACPTGRTCTGGACVATTPGTTPVQQHGNLSVKGTQLVNQYGNPVQLKGVSSQWLNYESDGYATNLNALIWMRDNWKLSVIRAAMGVDADQTGAYMYSAAGKANMKSQVETIIQNAVTAGVYVIVDWHSHKAEQYTTEANLFFRDISQRYGQYPNVIYETYNEPLDVDWYTLKEYHQNIYTSVRSYDADRNENVILLGTPNWDQDVDVAAADPMAGDTNVMYTLHFYACSHNSYYGQLAKAKKALSMGLPIFVSEWGATKADGGTGGSGTCASYADEWHSWMNSNSISWAAWKLDDCDGLTVADTSCILLNGAPLTGGWTSTYLTGHGPYVVSKMLQ